MAMVLVFAGNILHTANTEYVLDILNLVVFMQFI